MKTIHQLRKLARRISRLQRRCRHKLAAKNLPPLQFLYWRDKFAATVALAQMLQNEILRRRIGTTAVRCALPLKVQRELLAENPMKTRMLLGQSLRVS